MGLRWELMLLVVTDPAFEAHNTGPGHPERARRTGASLAGVDTAGLRPAAELVEPRLATGEELALVHPTAYLEALERFCAEGGGNIDSDTRACAESWRAARL